MIGGRDLAYAHIPKSRGPGSFGRSELSGTGPWFPRGPDSYRPREISGSGSVGQGAGDVVVGVGPGEWLAELDWLGDALLAGLVPGLCVAWRLALAVAEPLGGADAPAAGCLGAGPVPGGASDADPPGAVVAGGDTVRWSAAGESCSAPLASSQATPAPASTVTPAASVVARRRPGLPGRSPGECGCAPGCRGARGDGGGKGWSSSRAVSPVMPGPACSGAAPAKAREPVAAPANAGAATVRPASAASASRSRVAMAATSAASDSRAAGSLAVSLVISSSSSGGTPAGSGGIGRYKCPAITSAVPPS
jgi:hypothetical protein